MVKLDKKIFSLPWFATSIGVIKIFMVLQCQVDILRWGYPRKLISLNNWTTGKAIKNVHLIRLMSLVIGFGWYGNVETANVTADGCTRRWRRLENSFEWTRSFLYAVLHTGGKLSETLETECNKYVDARQEGFWIREFGIFFHTKIRHCDWTFPKIRIITILENVKSVKFTRRSLGYFYAAWKYLRNGIKLKGDLFVIRWPFKFNGRRGKFRKTYLSCRRT